MKNLAGKTVLGQLLVRLARARQLDGVVVATTTAPADEIICAESRKYGVMSFRGSEADVLSRYHGAALACSADAIVRITSDCPLFDPAVLDAMLVIFRNANRDAVKVDYMSNVERRTFPARPGRGDFHLCRAGPRPKRSPARLRTRARDALHPSSPGMVSHRLLCRRGGFVPASLDARHAGGLGIDRNDFQHVGNRWPDFFHGGRIEIVE